MLPTTIQILKSGLQADPSLTPHQRARLLTLLRNGATETAVDDRERVARIVRRREAAERLSCSLRTVDKLAADGVLPKLKLPGRVRSSGFLERDLIALITAENKEPQ